MNQVAGSSASARAGRRHVGLSAQLLRLGAVVGSEGAKSKADYKAGGSKRSESQPGYLALVAQKRVVGWSREESEPQSRFVVEMLPRYWGMAQLECGRCNKAVGDLWACATESGAKFWLRGSKIGIAAKSARGVVAAGEVQRVGSKCLFRRAVRVCRKGMVTLLGWDRFAVAGHDAGPCNELRHSPVGRLVDVRPVMSLSTAEGKAVSPSWLRVKVTPLMHGKCVFRCKK